MVPDKNYKSMKDQIIKKLSLLQKAYSKYGLLLLAAFILAAGFYAYKFYSTKQTEETDITDTFEEAIPAQCENGEWTTFPAPENAGKYKKFSENAKIKYVEDKNKFTSEDGSRTFLTDKDYSLFFFMDREVRAEGYDMGEQGKYVQKIKCVGEEADKNIQAERRKLMNYISDNLDSLSLEKSSKSPWQINSFYFVNNADLYVEYESPESLGGEAAYDGRLWLIRATKLDRNVPEIETLAYIREDEEDPDQNVLKIGEDLYRDNINMTIYEYDEDLEQWVLQ